MKRVALLLLIASAFALSGCKGSDAGYKVDQNDPSSVANASKTEPVPMNSDGTPVQPGVQPTPPAKP